MAKKGFLKMAGLSLAAFLILGLHSGEVSALGNGSKVTNSSKTVLLSKKGDTFKYQVKADKGLIDPLRQKFVQVRRDGFSWNKVSVKVIDKKTKKSVPLKKLTFSEKMDNQSKFTHKFKIEEDRDYEVIVTESDNKPNKVKVEVGTQPFQP